MRVTEQKTVKSRLLGKTRYLVIILGILTFTFSNFSDGARNSGGLHAQEFLKGLLTKSPGPLSKPHAELDTIKGCVDCHKSRLGGDVAHEKCVDCHSEFKSRLNKKGFHKDKSECKDCHADHKGLNSTIFAPKDWQKTFNHEDTDYSLVGKHASLQCQQCHNTYRKNSKTKEPTSSVTYLDAPTDCYSCHKSDYEHKFSQKDLLNCNQCHASSIESWKKLARKMQFDHAKTDYPLEGLHQKVKCADCHKPDTNKKRVTTFAPLAFAECTNCHSDPHKGKFGTECSTCHSVYRKWSDIIPNKEGKTSVPTTTTGVKGKKGKAGKETTPVLKGFDHSATKFALKGYHQAVACESCHTNPAAKFKIKKFNECSDCHGLPHGEQFKNQSCDGCHTFERRFMNSTFDAERHGKTRFPLSGKHQVLDCNKCHFSGTFENLPSQNCSDCHLNPHDARQIDKECSFCHVTTTFSWINFDHNKSTKFNLTGKHRAVACVSCHVNEVFKNMPASNEKPSCESCHETPHGAAMPTDCTTCHRTEGFKTVPNFDHGKFGKWTLGGRHSELSCQKCHSKHLLKDYSVPVTQKNVRTTDCANCHADIHKGTYGKNCESCHNLDTFSVEYGAKVHDLGFFKLQGYHDRLGCTDCHRPDTNLQGLGMVCGNCHKKNDIHSGKLGILCGDCHGQTAWLPTKFKHNQTGFRLNGAHRYAKCSDCHKNQIYEGLPNDCFFCHSDSYVRMVRSSVSVPEHGPSVVQDCANCHSEISWKIRKGSGLRIGGGL